MIRLFTALCKLKFEELSDQTIFQDATDGFNHFGKKCPCCGASGKLSLYSSYSRYLVSYKDGEIIEYQVCTRRVKCECGATHALLPDITIPYSSYSLRFKLAVLIAYFKRDTTVVAICERFGIAVSTLYAWKVRLLEHKALLLGVLLSQKKTALEFLRSLFDSTDLSVRLCRFYRKHAFSFLQNKLSVTTSSAPP